MRGSWKTLGLAAAPLAVTFVLVGCTKQQAQPQSTPPATVQQPAPPPPAAAPQQKGAKVEESAAVQAARKLGTPTDKPVVTTPSGLQYIDVKEGQGDPAKAGDVVQMNYTGWLENGTMFDTSARQGKPFVFRLGVRGVIAGWDEGVPGMKPAGIRKLIIPPQLGYGAQGYPPVIPANATLIFEVEYLGKQ